VQVVVLKKVFDKYAPQDAGCVLPDGGGQLSSEPCLLPAALPDTLAALGDRHHATMADPEAEMRALLHRFDASEDGVLDEGEFLEMAAQIVSDLAVTQEAFAALDTNEDGKISYSKEGSSELQRAASLLGGHTSGKLGIDKAQVQDTDGDGSLDHSEFANLVLSTPKHSCVSIMYIDRAALSEAVEMAPLVAAVLAGTVALVGGIPAMPSTYPMMCAPAFPARPLCCMRIWWGELLTGSVGACFARRLAGVGSAYCVGSLMRIWALGAGGASAIAGLPSAVRARSPAPPPPRCAESAAGEAANPRPAPRASPHTRS
jgi:Ca2+-binding EF-hand superfamily protein